MLERKHVNFYARSSKVREDIAERDIALTYVLHILSGTILPQLAFKGGTCLKKTYFGKTGRFSMDLDFTSLNITLEELGNKLKQLFDNKTHYGIDFKIIDENVGFESYLAVVEYQHEWNPGSRFELQVSYREKPVFSTDELCLIEEMYFKFCEFQNFPVKCLQKEELLAEKIRAAFQRIRSRDLYDLYLFANRPYNKDLVKTLAVIKCWNARDPFNPEMLLDRLAKEEYDWEDLKRLVRKGNLPSKKDIINTVIKEYSFLKDLNDPLPKIIEDSKAHHEEELVNVVLSNLNKKTKA
ncbi:MAG: nucleotidyl transferase AbiEii/AbiGii toxin family protein [Candidatus Bathyarchaeota archaeon]|nr:nucleotidyl transferase AbiEii/AbiGii toxin family protein [Candidatus Bathyarchaeum sp.]